MDQRLVPPRTGRLAAVVIVAAMAWSQACAGDGPGTPQQDLPAQQDGLALDADAVDLDAPATDVAADLPVEALLDAVDADAPAPDGIQPVADPAAASRAFRLYYRERVERAVVAYNRFHVFGDTTMGINIRKAGVSRKGDVFEVVPGPNDNNDMGVSTRVTWYAYKVFRSRLLALSLVRMFEGMAFIATVSGHDGVTGRNAYPGWTMTIDGTSGTAQRTRAGVAVNSPNPAAAALESEILATLFGGIRVTYRMEPPDILLSYMPAVEVAQYAATYNFSMLPTFLRVSDCCTSLMQVPAPYPWAGAFFSNHNSRDNFPDLSFGYLAAREAMDDPDADADVRAAAAHAWKAGQTVGDLVQSNGSRIMTVAETGPYDTLTVSGAVRPDGTTETEDLGSMSDCQMTFLARALSAAGLTLPVPELPEPGALDDLVSPLLDPTSGCTPQGSAHTCTRLADAFCGKTWAQMNDLTVNGQGLIDLARSLEAETPGTGKLILGHFYGNYDQPMNSVLALYEYAKVVGDAALLAAAAGAVGEMTAMSRTFADVIYGSIDPAQLARKRYLTALVDAQGGQAASAADLGDFSSAEQQMARLESLLDLADTTPAALMTDEDIAKRVADELSGDNDAVKNRYAAAWGTTPPIRRTADGYEARVFGKDGASDWHAVDTPHHTVVGGLDLLEAMPLCVTSPGLLDCAWARLGCARPDLDHDGVVGDSDRQVFQQAAAKATTGCAETNQWCGGADLDHTGSVDAVDSAFLDAAQGCHYAVAGTPRAR